MRRIRAVTAITLTLFFLAIGRIRAAPYPESDAILGVTFDWASHRRLATGSDNWPVTWADDGHQYASWGDGNGFAGPVNSRASLGVARVEGSGPAAADFKGCNVWGGKASAGCEAPASDSFTGKSYGLISVEGVLYMWWGPGSNTKSYQKTQLLRSADKGRTWTDPLTTWSFTEVDPALIMPTILNFGKDYAGARDGYVYHYFIRKQGTPNALNVHKPGMIDLARVPKDQLTSQGAYEFYGGMGAYGIPIWTTATNRVPVFEDTEGVGWTVSVSYNAGLKRYFLITEHTASFAGNIGLFEAPEPWGPWRTVLYQNGWGEGYVATTGFFWNFANKWLGADGRNFTLVFTGTGENDSWNTVTGSFTISQAQPSPTPTPGGMTPVKGDTDGDGDVDYPDVRGVWARYDSPSDAWDFNLSGRVDLFDLNALLQNAFWRW